MRRILARPLLVGLVAAASTGILMDSVAHQAKDKKPAPAASKSLRIPLTKYTVKKDSLRMGWDYRIDPPSEGWMAKLPKGMGPGGIESLLFFDMSEGGTLEPGTSDGLAVPGLPFVVLLPERLLLKSGQYKVSFEELKALVLTPEDLGSAQRYVQDASIFTELRIRSGLTPVPLVPELCEACEKHCDYMKLNGLADGGGGLASHVEEEGKPGYTKEGADAGKNSNISFGEPVDKSIVGCFASVWHGVSLVNPRLSCFGVGLKNGVALTHLGRQDGFQDSINLHPPDGAVGVLRGFSPNGEFPNPVSGTQGGRGCGFPILIRLIEPYNDLQSVEVVNPKGVRVPGTFSSPAKPANPIEWPTNSRCAAFVPSRPLEANMLYQVIFQFADPKEPVRWSFTTGDR